jgi:hypothetical protein
VDATFFFFGVGVLVIQACYLLHASAKRELETVRRDVQMLVMSMSRPRARARRLITWASLLLHLHRLQCTAAHHWVVVHHDVQMVEE